MQDHIRQTITHRFDEYVNTFRDSRGELAVMLQLKLIHTMRVVKDAKLIMQGEAWSIGERPTGEICALLHDIGRFSQFQEFGTFRDSESLDHARHGIEIANRIKILEGVPEANAQRIVEAIQWHNKKALPEDMEIKTALLAHLVRDADKLDIFSVMQCAVEDGSLEKNPEITWGLDIKGIPNPEIVEAVIQGEAVDYSKIHTLCDFIIIQLGWVISGFHNQTALRIAKERHVVDFRRRYLKTLTSSPAIDRCCDQALQVLLRLDEIKS